MTTTPTISREAAIGYDGGAEQCCKSCGQLLGYRSTDKLTGLLDRWGWDASAPQAFARAVGQRRSTALLIVDLDWFKLVNDEFGHPAGDAVLRSTAAVLRNASREGDLVGRYGGDEFLMLLSPSWPGRGSTRPRPSPARPRPSGSPPTGRTAPATCTACCWTRTRRCGRPNAADATRSES
jgi:hypothetical protein